MSKEQILQENQYNFPYHHIPSFDNGSFSQTKNLFWGYEYMSYTYFVLGLIKKMEFNTLLDVGCGDGKFLYEAHKMFENKKLTGIDYSQKAILLARAINQNDITFIKDNIMEGSQVTDKYDVITLMEVLEHIKPDETDKFLRGIKNKLQPNGHFILTVPSTNIAVNKKHYRHFDLEKLEKITSPYFKIKQSYFLNKKGRRTKILEKIMGNRLFLLNHRGSLNLIYRYYTKRLLNASQNNCSRICIVFINN